MCVIVWCVWCYFVSVWLLLCKQSVSLMCVCCVGEFDVAMFLPGCCSVMNLILCCICICAVLWAVLAGSSLSLAVCNYSIMGCVWRALCLLPCVSSLQEAQLASEPCGSRARRERPSLVPCRCDSPLPPRTALLMHSNLREFHYLSVIGFMTIMQYEYNTICQVIAGWLIVYGMSFIFQWD